MNYTFVESQTLRKLIELGRIGNAEEVRRGSGLHDEILSMEIDIDTVPASERREVNAYGDLMQDYLYINPEHKFLTVLDPSNAPASECHLFCFRHPKSHQVHFLTLSRFYKALLQRLIQGECNGRQAVEEIASELDLPLNAQVFDAVRRFFQDLLSREVILGFE